MDFDKLKQRSWLAWAAVAFLVVLCAVLASMQYSWIGQVASAESHRLREDLQYRLNLLRRDLNDQVSSACYSYIPSAAEIQRLGRDAAYLEKFRQRKDAGDRIVGRIALAVPKNIDLNLLVPDRTRTRFYSQPWPSDWADMQVSLLTRVRGGPVPSTQSSTLVEFPRFAPGEDPDQPRMAEQEWLLIELDANYIARTIVPELITRYLGRPGKDEYDADIVVRSNSSEYIYRSPSHSAADAGWVADATVPLLDINRSPDPQSELSADNVVSPESDVSPLTASSLPPGRFPGLWLLRVHRHTGSLDAIVTQARHRNIILSAGLLLLLFATVVLLVRFSRRAQDIAEMQMNFVASVSHELRTPLTVIRTAAFNLRGTLASQPEQVTRYGTLIRQEAEKLSALVEQVLRYGNARAGRVLQQRERLAIPELIEASLLAARGSAPASQVMIEKHLEPDLPPILADRESMQHALQNLIDNAIKYGTRGSEAGIGISATASKNGGPLTVEIRVSDRGAGIPEKELPYVFDPFFRGHRPVQNQIHGTGLGLNLVKRIIEAHRGTISVHNRPDRGAEFVVRIPGAPANFQADVSSPSQQSEPL